MAIPIPADQHISLSENPMKHTLPKAPVALYPRIIGATWTDLAGPVQEFHIFSKQLRGTGLFTVRHGSGFLARKLAWLMRLPPAGENIPVQLIVDADDNSEKWNRSFAGKPFITKQSECAGGLMAEHIGLMEIRYRLTVVDHELRYEQTKAALRLGALRIPLPRWLSPHIAAREWAASDERGTNVSVSVTAPFTGLLINYQGYIVSED